MGALEDYLEELRLKEAQRLAQAQANLNDLQLSAKQQDDDIVVSQLQGNFELDKNAVRGLSAEETRIARERFRTEMPQIMRTRAQQAASQEEQMIRGSAAESSNQNLEQIRQIASLKNMRFTDPQFDATIPRDDALRSQIVVDPKTGAQEVQPKPGLSEQATRITEFAQRFNLPEEVVRQKFVEDQLEDLSRRERISKLLDAPERLRLRKLNADKAAQEAEDALEDRPTERANKKMKLAQDNQALKDKATDYPATRELDIGKFEEAQQSLDDQARTRATQRKFANLDTEARKAGLAKQFVSNPSAIQRILDNPDASQEERDTAAYATEAREALTNTRLDKDLKSLTGHFRSGDESGLAEAIKNAWGKAGVYRGFEFPAGTQPGEFSEDAIRHFMPLWKQQAMTTMEEFTRPGRAVEEESGIGGDIDWVMSQAQQETDSWMDTLQRAATGGFVTATQEEPAWEEPEPQTMGDVMRKLPKISSIPRSFIDNLVGEKKAPQGAALEEWLRRARRQGTM